MVIALSALVPATPASASVRTEDGGNVPFYARITTIGEPDQIFQDGDRVAIAFYRPPGCVPLDFNLLAVFDFPRAFDCVDPDTGLPTTDGFNLWRTGPGIDPAPYLSVTHGLGAVPFWFVDADRLRAAMALNNDLTMAELIAIRDDPEIPGLVLVGYADSFRQVLHPHDAARVPKTQFVARGSLEDGRPFRVRGLFIEGKTIQTDIDID